MGKERDNGQMVEPSVCHFIFLSSRFSLVAAKNPGKANPHFPD